MRNISDKEKELIIDVFPMKNTLAIIVFGSYGTERQMMNSDIDIAWIPKSKVAITEIVAKTQALKEVLDLEIDLKIVSNNFPIELRRNVFDGDIIYEDREFRDYLNDFYVENSDILDILDWREMHGSKK